MAIRTYLINKKVYVKGRAMYADDVLEANTNDADGPSAKYDRDEVAVKSKSSPVVS